MRSRLEEVAIDEPNQSRLTAALAARRRGTHEKFIAAVDKGTTLSNEEARLAFRYHFSLKLMEKLPIPSVYADTTSETARTS